MKAFITKCQVYDESDDLICTLNAFDEESFSIKWANDDYIYLPEHLRFIADLIESKELYSEIIKKK